MSVLRGRHALLAGAALVLVTELATPAHADAPDPACTAPANPQRYLVVFDKGTPRASVTNQLDAACGTAAVYYPSIGVGVAYSADPRFRQRIGVDRAFSAQAEHTRRLKATTSSTDGPPPHELNPFPRGKVDRTPQQWDMRAIQADKARAVHPGSRDVLVGVLDSGIDPTHPDLASAVDPSASVGCLSGVPDTSAHSWRPTSSAHGTHVAGTIAAADDGIGTTGVAPGVRLASVKVVDERGEVTPEAAVCGLMWAAKQHMSVTNNSFFVNPRRVACAPASTHPVVREALSRAFEYSTGAGTLPVAAATNGAAELTRSRASGHVSGRDARPGCEALPASLPDTLTVSSVGPDETKAGYSSYGLGVIDMTAPGGAEGAQRARPQGGAEDCVLSTVPHGYASLCGTSMAAPHVTGVAALVASAHPSGAPRQLRATLTERARPIECPADYDLAGDGTQDAYCTGYRKYNGFYGHGMVDALSATSTATSTASSTTGDPAGDLGRN